MTTEQTIRKFIAENSIILFMKGTPEAPQCGFSARAVAALRGIDLDFAYVDVLNSPRIREMLPRISQFPTFPQLYVRGELIGGSDIVEEMAKSGELICLAKGKAAPTAEAS